MEVWRLWWRSGVKWEEVAKEWCEVGRSGRGVVELEMGKFGCN